MYAGEVEVGKVLSWTIPTSHTYQYSIRAVQIMATKPRAPTAIPMTNPPIKASRVMDVPC